MTAKVEIYTWSNCPYSTRAKELLQKKEVGFIEYCIDDDEPARNLMVQRANGKSSIPQIFIDDQHVGGCEDLYVLEDLCSLDLLLNQDLQSIGRD